MDEATIQVLNTLQQINPKVKVEYVFPSWVASFIAFYCHDFSVAEWYRVQGTVTPVVCPSMNMNLDEWHNFNDHKISVLFQDSNSIQILTGESFAFIGVLQCIIYLFNTVKLNYSRWK